MILMMTATKMLIMTGFFIVLRLILTVFDHDDDDDNHCLGNRDDEDVFDVEEVTGCDGGGVI